MSCSMLGCKSVKRFKPEGIHFYQFPGSPQLRTAWINILGRGENWTWTKNKLVCSRHFSPEDLISYNERSILKRNAVPSLLLGKSFEFTRPTSTEYTNIASLSKDSFETSVPFVSLSSNSSLQMSQERKLMITLKSFRQMGIKGHSRTPASRIYFSDCKENTKSSSSEETLSCIPEDQELVIASSSRNRQDQNTLVASKNKSPDKFVSTKFSPDSEGLKRTPKRIRKDVKMIHTYSMPPKLVTTKLDISQDKLKVVRGKNKAKNQQVKQLKHKITHLRQALNILSKKKLVEDECIKVIDKTLTGIPSALMKRLLSNINKGKITRKKIPPELRNFAMTLQFYSSKAYDYVRKTFRLSLPSPSDKVLVIKY